MNGCSPIFPISKCLSAKAGFTLVELIMTVVIMGVLVAVVAPRFNDVDVFQSRGFADQVQATLRYAQKIAIAQRSSVSATISLAASSDCGATLSAGNVNCVISNSATTSGIPMSVVFDALGRPNAAVSATVGTTTITVEAETGYVHQ